MLNTKFHVHSISRATTWPRLKGLGVIAVLVAPLLATTPAFAQSATSSTTSASQQTDAANTAPESQKGPLLSKDKELAALRDRGERLINGWNTKPNTDEGVKLLESAIEQGDRESLIVLGRFYVDGLFLKRDRRRALELFERAAKLGDYEGIEALGEDLMWNGRTFDDKREAERLLSMAGSSGRGSAWTTLGYGAIYGKLTGSASAKYETYVQNARALGDKQIEIVDTERLLYRSGAKGKPVRAIRNLETAAETGNQDAIKYLIRLVRDGNRYNVERSLPRARAYLKKYGEKLSPTLLKQQEFLLQAAVTPAPSFTTLSGKAHAIPDFATVDFQKQVFQANSSFSVYLAQEALKKKQLYRGPLNGRATKRTLSSLRAACDALVWKSGCDKKLMSDRSMATIIKFALIEDKGNSN